MRSLTINKRPLWMVRPTGAYVDYVDSDGFKTGEKVKEYSVPVIILVNYRGDNGKVSVLDRGLVFEDDLTISSCNVVLEKGDLLFNEEPISDFDTTYDYVVDRIQTSINGNYYGLKART